MYTLLSAENHEMLYMRYILVDIDSSFLQAVMAIFLLQTINHLAFSTTNQT